VTKIAKFSLTSLIMEELDSLLSQVISSMLMILLAHFSTCTTMKCTANWSSTWKPVKVDPCSKGSLQLTLTSMLPPQPMPENHPMESTAPQMMLSMVSTLALVSEISTQSPGWKMLMLRTILLKP